ALTGYPTDQSIAIQWESSPAGQNNFSLVAGGNTPVYTVTGVNASTDFRAAVACQNIGGGTAYSNIITVNVNNPQLVSTTPGTSCGGGIVQLSATPAGTATVNWYDVATGGVPLATGNNFSTPSIGTTTTFYAAASSGGFTANVGLPNRVGTTTNTGYTDIGLMFNALTPFVLNSVAVYPVGTGGTVATTVALMNASGAIVATTTVNLTTSASPGTKTTVPLNFNVPAGNGYRLVLNGATGGGISGFIREATTGFTYPYTLPGVISITSAYTSGASSAYYYYFYDWQISTGCEGSRVPVVATVNPGTPILPTASPDSICLGSSSTLNVTSANSNYSFTWTGFSAGPSVTVSPVTTTTYYVTATDAVANCTATDSVIVAVKATAAVVTTTSNVTDICISDVVNLGLSPVPTAGITYQWQKDTGAGFADISGANTANYTETATVSTSYQAKMYCNGILVNTSVPVGVTVNNPAIIETFPGARCNAGPVTLVATATQGAIINWYAAATGGTSIGVGGAFTTPSLTSTTTYYVSASDGGGITTTGRASALSTATPGAGTTNFGLMFDVLAPVTLNTVTVYPVSATSATGTVKIDVINSSGTIIHTATVPVTGSPGGVNPQTVTLNFNLLPGTNYKLRPGAMTGFSQLLFEPSAGAPGGNYGYPFVVPGYLSINTSTLTAAPTNTPRNDLYYYFYNWTLTTGCESARVAVDATINGTSSGTGLAYGGSTVGDNHTDGSTVSYSDVCLDKVVSVSDAPGGNVLGVTSAIVVTPATVQTHMGLPYVPRIFDITPSSDGPATVTLYALQSEFTAYNNYVTANSLNLPLLPTGPADVTGTLNIVVTQYHGDALDGTTGPAGLYDATLQQFIPNSNIVTVWNGQYWAMTFPVTGFSGFFIHSGSSPLEIDLDRIMATNQGSRNRVDWSTKSENGGEIFEVERSLDATAFSYLGTVKAKGNAASYSYWDNNPVNGTNYYRLKIREASGSFTYSPVVSAVVKSAGTFRIEAYPNPARELVTISLFGSVEDDAVITITDVTGKEVKKLNVQSAKLIVDVSGLASGVYLVRYSDKNNSASMKLTRE
ncbi:MAG: T9SS type A sorting domain-containing protein, partial [Sphingobacteriales bacterium]